MLAFVICFGWKSIFVNFITTIRNEKPMTHFNSLTFWECCVTQVSQSKNERHQNVCPVFEGCCLLRLLCPLCRPHDGYLVSMSTFFFYIIKIRHNKLERFALTHLSKGMSLTKGEAPERGFTQVSSGLASNY
jgi:hypothetical protein